MADDYILNEHNKEEFPPSHTAEHLLNQTMIRLFGCERSYNAHVERKKSKMSFHLDHKPTRQEEKEIERHARSSARRCFRYYPTGAYRRLRCLPLYWQACTQYIPDRPVRNAWH